MRKHMMALALLGLSMMSFSSSISVFARDRASLETKQRAAVAARFAIKERAALDIVRIDQRAHKATATDARLWPFWPVGYHAGAGRYIRDAKALGTRYVRGNDHHYDVPYNVGLVDKWGWKLKEISRVRTTIRLGEESRLASRKDIRLSPDSEKLTDADQTQLAETRDLRFADHPKDARVLLKNERNEKTLSDKVEVVGRPAEEREFVVREVRSKDNRQAFSVVAFQE